MAQWTTTGDAVRRLRVELDVVVNTRYVRDSVKRGRLPGFEMDGVWYVDYAELHRRFSDAIGRAARGEP